MKPPSPKGVSLLGGFQTKNPEEEDLPWRTTPKIDQSWILFFRGGPFPLDSGVGNHLTKKTPGGKGFYRSIFPEWASYDQNVWKHLFVYQCFLTFSITPHSDLLHFHSNRDSLILFPVLPIRQWLYCVYVNVCSNETSETLTLMKLKCHGNMMYASLWNINACVTFFHVYAHLDIFACIYVLIDIDIRHSHTHVCTFIRVSMCVHKYFSHE